MDEFDPIEDDIGVVEPGAEERITDAVGGVGQKRKYDTNLTSSVVDDSNLFRREIVCNGAACQPAEASESQVSQEPYTEFGPYPPTRWQRVFREQEERCKERVKIAETALATCQTNSINTITNNNILHDIAIDSAKEIVRSTVEVVKIKNEVIAAQKTALDKMTAIHKTRTSIAELLKENEYKRIALLGECITKLKEDIKKKDTLMADRHEEHMITLESVRLKCNELRYATEFGESLSRGKPMCPISRNFIMPKETVLMMLGTCRCQCLVKYQYAAPLIKQYHSTDPDEAPLMCMTCNSDVDDVHVTTAENAAILYAWHDLESVSGCDELDGIYADHVKKTEKDKADQTLQDTSNLRAQLDAVNAAATSI
jgi:hypothetical protein